jgi:hypothetical protein
MNGGEDERDGSYVGDGGDDDRDGSDVDGDGGHPMILYHLNAMR